MCSEQQQRRTDPLAATLAQIFGNFGNGADAGSCVAAQFLLDCYEIFPQQLEYLSCRRYRQSAQAFGSRAFCPLAGFVIGAVIRCVPAGQGIS